MQLYDIMNEKKYYVVTSDDCVHCEEIKKNIDKLSVRGKGKENIEVVDLFTEKGIDIVTSLDANYIPLAVEEINSRDKDRYRVCDIEKKDNKTFEIICSKNES